MENNFLVEILILIFFTAVAGFAGSIAGFKYFAMVSYRQQKAVLVLLIQEFFLLIKRCTMYYKQYLNNAVSFSTLFEISDSSTFVKLSELTENMDCIKHATEFKAGVFQAVRYANKASECMIEKIHHQTHGNSNAAAQAGLEAMNHQNMALNFFIGEQKTGGNFDRNLYVKYTNNLKYLLNYLDQLNSPSKIECFFSLLMPEYKNRKKIAIDAFILEQKEILSLIIEEIELLRKKEKILISKVTTKPSPSPSSKKGKTKKKTTAKPKKATK